MANLFTKFYPDFQLAENANVIVVDFGDGEITARYLSWRKNAFVSEVPKTLYIHKKTPQKAKLTTILVAGNTDGQADLDSKDTELRTIDQLKKKPFGNSFRHFKCKPLHDTPWVGLTARFTSSDGGWQRNVLYKSDLIAYAFDTVQQGIFASVNAPDNMNTGIHPESQFPTYIFVGRPSDKEWDEQEKDYQKILTSHIQDYSFGGQTFKKNDIKVFVLPEADAAYAELVCKERGGRKLSNNEYVIIIDLGSSTIDVTVVRGTEVIYRDSYTIGGGDLDDCLVKAAMKRKESDLNRYGGFYFDEWIVDKFRFAKEDGFEDPKSKDMSNHPRVVSGITSMFVDDALMEDAIERTPVQSKDEKGIEYPSWKDCIVAYLKKVKQTITKKQGNAKLTHLMVTGGVSNMCIVRNWIEEIFGIAPECVKNPSESVVMGASYIAIKEMQILNCRKMIHDEVKKILENDNVRRSFGKCVDWRISESVYYTLVYLLKQWRDGNYDSVESYRDFHNEMKKFTMHGRIGDSVFGKDNGHQYPEGYQGFNVLALSDWIRENDLNAKLQNAVDESVRAIFPNSDMVFRKSLDISQALHGISFDDVIYHYTEGLAYMVYGEKNSDLCKRAVDKETDEKVYGILDYFRWGNYRTCYSKASLLRLAENNRNKLIGIMAGNDQYNREDNAEFMERFGKVLKRMEDAILQEIDAYTEEIRPYNLLGNNG